MAEYNYVDASVTLNSVDLSDHVTTLSCSWDLDMLETTAMGTTTGRTFIAGLYNWSVNITFNQDFAAAEVDATLAAIQAGGVAVALVLLPTSAAASATNPSWTGNVLLSSYPFLDGSVADLGSTSVTLQGSGTLTRAEA